MGYEVMGNSGIVSGGHAGITPTIELNRDHGCNDGFMGGQGIWAILLLSLLGRRGFGDNDCGNGGGWGGGGSVLPVQAINQNTDWNGLLTNQNINNSAQIAAVADAKSEICTTREALLNGFGNTRTELATGFGLVSLEGCRQTNQLGQIGLENRYQNALGQSNTDAKLAQCCCETQMLIQQTSCATNKNLDDKFAALSREIFQNKYEALRDKYEDVRLAYSQCNQNATLIGALTPPRPVPAYPVWNNAPIFTPSISANSFCGFGNTSFQGGSCGGIL